MTGRLGTWHWTTYAVILLAIFSLGFFSYTFWVNEKIADFESAITEAGGIVHYNRSTTAYPFDLGSRRFYPTPRSPVSVEFISGSHPMPEQFTQIKSLRSIKYLILNTSPIGDHLTAKIGSFQQLEYLDLQHTYFTGPSILKLLDALPHLKELHISSDQISDTEKKQLLNHRRAAVIQFH